MNPLGQTKHALLLPLAVQTDSYDNLPCASIPPPVQGAFGQAAGTLDEIGLGRITAQVSDTVLTTLRGNVHPLARPRYNHGAVSARMPTGRMMLIIRRSDAQNTALHHYLDDLQNPASPHYSRWLTPESYGARYGISNADLAEVKGWLTDHGFKIEHVPAARNLVLFSGTTGAIETASHTSIHSYVILGEHHYANSLEPKIPAALVPVVAGILPVNDFRARPDHQPRRAVTSTRPPKRIRPDLTPRVGSSAHPVDLLFVTQPTPP